MSDDHTTFDPSNWHERPPVEDVPPTFAVGPASESVFDAEEGDFPGGFKQHALARVLADMRHRRELTQAELAERAGVSSSLIAHVETGRRNLSSRSLLRAAAALGASADECYDLEAAQRETTRAFARQSAPSSLLEPPAPGSTAWLLAHAGAGSLTAADLMASMTSEPRSSTTTDRFVALTVVAIEMARLLSEYVEGTISMEDAVEAVAITDTFERLRSTLIREATS